MVVSSPVFLALADVSPAGNGSNIMQVGGLGWAQEKLAC